MSDPNFTIPAEYTTLRRSLSQWFDIPTEEGQRAQYPKPMHPNNIRDPCVLAHKRAMNAVEDSYPHPFLVSISDNSRTPGEWGDEPRSVVELSICALSAVIRDKPD